MLQSHTLRAADFCDGSDLPDKLRTPFFRIMKLSEYHKIKKAAWVPEHDNLLRRIEHDEIDETPDGHCGFRVTARFLCLIGIICGGPLEGTARAVTPEILRAITWRMP